MCRFSVTTPVLLTQIFGVLLWCVLRRLSLVSMLTMVRLTLLISLWMLSWVWCRLTSGQLMTRFGLRQAIRLLWLIGTIGTLFGVSMRLGCLVRFSAKIGLRLIS